MEERFLPSGAAAPGWGIVLGYERKALSSEEQKGKGKKGKGKKGNAMVAGLNEPENVFEAYEIKMLLPSTKSEKGEIKHFPLKAIQKVSTMKVAAPLAEIE